MTDIQQRAAEAVAELRAQAKQLSVDKVWARAHTDDIAREKLRLADLITELAEQVPRDGWKLVPVEPTDEMIEAAARAKYEKHWDGPPEKMPDEAMKNVWREFPRSAWPAMLAASPPPEEKK